MIVQRGDWRSHEFDASVTQIIKWGFYVPYGFDQWVVLDDFIFWSARYQKAIVVPQWFLTDLASIPKGFRWLISVNEPHRDIALGHDVCYSFGEQLGITKEQSDLFFCDGLIESEIPKWKRIAMYEAVNLFGGASWRKKEPRFCSDAVKYDYMKRYAHLMILPFENGEPMLLDGYEKAPS